MQSKHTATNKERGNIPVDATISRYTPCVCPYHYHLHSHCPRLALLLSMTTAFRRCCRMCLLLPPFDCCIFLRLLPCRHYPRSLFSCHFCLQRPLSPMSPSSVSCGGIVVRGAVAVRQSVCWRWPITKSRWQRTSRWGQF